MKVWKIKVHYISEVFFQYSLVTYMAMRLAETFKQGFVSFFFDPNILLVVVLISGVVMVLTHHEQLERLNKPHRITGSDIQSIILFSAGGAMLVFYKTQDIGAISIAIALLTAVIIGVLSVLILTDEQ
jgi:hypothetical protein